jgi:hypothetical protein
MILAAVAILLVVSFAGATYVFMRGTGGPSQQVSDSAPSTKIDAGHNLLLPSNDFAHWQRYQVADVESAPVIAPDGKNSASRVIESGDNGRHYITTTITGVTPGVKTFSVYFKPNERSIGFEMSDITPGKYGAAMCDVSKAGPSGSYWLKTGDIVDAAVEDVGNGWYRCWGAMPFTLANVVLVIQLRDEKGMIQYQGDGRSGVLVWGARFEIGNKPAANLAISQAKPNQ